MEDLTWEEMFFGGKYLLTFLKVSTPWLLWLIFGFHLHHAHCEGTLLMFSMTHWGDSTGGGPCSKCPVLTVVLISNLLLDFLQRFLETSAGGYRENSSNPMISKAYQATNGMSIVVEGGRLYSILVSRHFSLQLAGTLSWTRTSMEEDEYMRPPRLCPLQMP